MYCEALTRPEIRGSIEAEIRVGVWEDGFAADMRKPAR